MILVLYFMTQKNITLSLFVIALISFLFIYHSDFLISSKNNLDRYDKPSFEDFPVTSIYNGTSTEVNISSNPNARQFRTALRWAVKGNPPNFAGHYIVAEWGCGSSCQSGMIIDTISGTVYDMPDEATTRGIEYKLDSFLFITNPFYEDDPTRYIYDIPAKYYLWKNNKFNLIYVQEL